LIPLETSIFFSLPTVLTVFDTLVVLAVILLKGLPSTADFSYHITILPILHPIMNISWLMSICLTVSITVERYYSVCLKKNSKKVDFKIKIGLIITFLFAVIYNIPKCMEYTWQTNPSRTDYDQYDEDWNNLRVDLNLDLYGKSHLEILHQYPEIIESGHYLRKQKKILTKGFRVLSGLYHHARSLRHLNFSAHLYEMTCY
jgi:hypothetical protein